MKLLCFSQIFISALFLGMVMYVNEFKTKEKQKLTGVQRKSVLQRAIRASYS